MPAGYLTCECKAQICRGVAICRQVTWMCKCANQHEMTFIARH